MKNSSQIYQKYIDKKKQLDEARKILSDMFIEVNNDGRNVNKDIGLNKKNKEVSRIIRKVMKLEEKLLNKGIDVKRFDGR